MGKAYSVRSTTNHFDTSHHCDAESTVTGNVDIKRSRLGKTSFPSPALNDRGLTGEDGAVELFTDSIGHKTIGRVSNLDGKGSALFGLAHKGEVHEERSRDDKSPEEACFQPSREPAGCLDPRPIAPRSLHGGTIHMNGRDEVGSGIQTPQDRRFSV